MYYDSNFNKERNYKRKNIKHNNIVAMSYAINCYTLDNALETEIESNNVFIIANERTKKNGEIGRYYTVFASFDVFIKHRNKYPHCHEILVDHKNNKLNPMGRLVFDFDIKPEKEMKIPACFKTQIETCIEEVVERYFNNVDINKFVYVWSTSQNPNKFSRHLTVKNLCFDDWISLSKTFYQLFRIIWDEKYFWISSNKLLDFQIVRKHASLRMVGSSKIDGHPLLLDEETHTLIDSLIRVYRAKDLEKEQIVTKSNINQSVFSNVLDKPEIDNAEENIIITFNPKKLEKPLYPLNIYDKAYEIYNQIDPGVFRTGKISGRAVSLMRIKPSKCLLSGRVHEHENAYLLIEKNDVEYSVYFVCFRYCHHIKKLFLAVITIDNMLVIMDPNIEAMVPKKKKKKFIVDI